MRACDRSGHPPRFAVFHRQWSRARTDFIGRDEMIGRRVANGIEELSAAMRVPPAFGVQPFDVVAQIQKLGPFGCGRVRRLGGTDDVRLSAMRELELRALAAI